MKRYIIMAFIAITAAFLFSCEDKPVNKDDDDGNKEVVPPEDTVYAELNISIEQGGDTVYSLCLNKLPYSFPRFSQVQNFQGNNPIGGAALFLMALKIYQQYNQEGIKALVSSVSEQVKMASTTNDSYNGYSLYTNDMSLIKSQLANYPKLTTAYVRGAAPENSYEPAGPPYCYDFKYDRNNQDIGSGSVRLYVLTKCADSPRPITIVKDSDGVWRAKSFSSLLAGMK